MSSLLAPPMSLTSIVHASEVGQIDPWISGGMEVSRSWLAVIGIKRSAWMW